MTVSIDSVPLEQFTPHILPLAEACPEFLMRRSLVATICDICRKTGCLTSTTEFDVKAGVAEYDIVPVDDSLTVEQVRQLYLDGAALKPMSHDQIFAAYHGVDPALKVGKPLFYTFQSKSRVILTPTPDADGHARIVFFASVPMRSPQVPRVFLDDWLDIVVDGTLSRLLRVAGQTFSNARMAEECRIRYEIGLNSIHREAAQDFTRAAGRVNFNQVL